MCEAPQAACDEMDPPADERTPSARESAFRKQVSYNHRTCCPPPQSPAPAPAGARPRHRPASPSSTFLQSSISPPKSHSVLIISWHFFIMSGVKISARTPSTDPSATPPREAKRVDARETPADTAEQRGNAPVSCFLRAMNFCTNCILSQLQPSTQQPFVSRSSHLSAASAAAQQRRKEACVLEGGGRRGEGVTPPGWIWPSPAHGPPPPQSQRPGRVPDVSAAGRAGGVGRGVAGTEKHAVGFSMQFSPSMPLHALLPCARRRAQ